MLRKINIKSIAGTKIIWYRLYCWVNNYNHIRSHQIVTKLQLPAGYPAEKSRETTFLGAIIIFILFIEL